MNDKGTKFAVTEPDGTAIGLENDLLDGLPQVRFIARGIHRRLPPHVPLDDLIQAGTLGLIDAVNKFDPTKHVPFKSYAQFRIRGAILDSLRQMDWGPRHLRCQGRRVEAARQALYLRLGRVPNEEELAEEMNVSIEQFQRLESALHGLGLSTLDSELSDTQSWKMFDNYLPATAEMDPFSICLQSEMRFHIERAQDGLNENERLVLTLYYVKEFTMEEVGRALGVGESRVSQIHSKAILYLRETLGRKLHTRKQNITETHGVNSVSNNAHVKQ
jgi:RNA polymerase sigma factor for flagellar operon FliA